MPFQTAINKTLKVNLYNASQKIKLNALLGQVFRSYSHMGERGTDRGAEGSPGLSSAGTGRGEVTSVPIPHSLTFPESRKKAGGERERQPREPTDEFLRENKVEGRTEKDRVAGGGFDVAAEGLSPLPRPFPAETEKGNRLPEAEGSSRRVKHPPSLLPMLGAPAGRSPVPPLLLQLLAPPLWRREAGPAPRSRPSRAQAGRGFASISARRSSDCPVSEAREKEAVASPRFWSPPKAAVVGGPSPPCPDSGFPTRVAPAEEMRPAGWSRPLAPTRRARRARRPAPRLSFKAGRSRTLRQRQKWKPGQRPGRCPELGLGGGKSRENPCPSPSRSAVCRLNSRPGLVPGAVTSQSGVARRQRPGVASGGKRKPQKPRLVVRARLGQLGGSFVWLSPPLITKSFC